MERIFLNLNTLLLLAFSILTSCTNKNKKTTIEETLNKNPITYYVDNISGNDNNNGQSQNAAWKTLAKVNTVTFKGGDKILLKAGGVWEQSTLKLKGSGAEQMPIIIDKYGTTEDKPLIKVPYGSSAIELVNVNFWEVNNVAITGETPTAYAAIKIWADDGFHNHIYIKNCEVYSFTGRSGIQISGSNDKVPSGFNDIKIENNYIHHCIPYITNGIEMWTYDDKPFGKSTNIYIARNRVVSVSGDGIVLQHCNNGLVEYNYVEDVGSAAMGNHAAIWCAFTNDAVFQYNEACFTRKPPTNNDGMAFDADLGANRTIFQYNYSHDNEGGFHLSMNDDDYEIIRYNISQNDQRRLFFEGFPSANCKIYNNVFFGPAVAIEILNYTQQHGGTWWNNLFWSNGASYTIPSTGANNYSWGSASGGIHVDPYLWAPNTGGKNIDMTDANRLPGYVLQSGSPLRNAGVVVQDNGGKDFWGKTLYTNAPDIGVDEK